MYSFEELVYLDIHDVFSKVSFPKAESLLMTQMVLDWEEMFLWLVIVLFILWLVNETLSHSMWLGLWRWLSLWQLTSLEKSVGSKLIKVKFLIHDSSSWLSKTHCLLLPWQGMKCDLRLFVRWDERRTERWFWWWLILFVYVVLVALFLNGLEG